MPGPFTVVETPAFAALVADYATKAGHKKLPDDLDWLKGRMAEAPERMGDHVPGLKGLPLPVFKARCKDTCHRLSASAAWRVYYAIHKEKQCLFLLFPPSQEGIRKSGKRFPASENGARVDPASAQSAPGLIAGGSRPCATLFPKLRVVSFVICTRFAVGFLLSSGRDAN